MTQARAVTATFNSAVDVRVERDEGGHGRGTVTSSPAGINCGTTCSANYASGTSVTLTAAAASGSTFAGWSGACTGTGTCVTSMTAARNVTATFNGSVSNFAATVTKAGTGAGTVTSSPTGINCGTTCSASYASGTAAHSNRGGHERLDVRWLEWRVHRNRNLRTVDDGSACGHGDVQHDPGNRHDLRESGHVHEQHGQLQYHGRGVLSDGATRSNGWGCSNFDGRTVTVGGVARTCGQLPVTRSADGYYYLAVTAGTYPWAACILVGGQGTL